MFVSIRMWVVDRLACSPDDDAVFCVRSSRFREGKSMAYDIGEKPGVGTYKCTKCNWKVRLDNNSDRLPPCGNCGKGQDTKYERV